MAQAQHSRVYRTEAIVLKGYNYGEADRILTLYTPATGKVRAIAKGVRRPRSRKSGHLDLFMRSNLLVARGRQLDIITQAEIIEYFGPIREDLWKSSYCHYVAELVDNFTREDLANYPVYALAVVTFRRIASSQNCDMVLRSFELQLLAMTGYRPQLHRCLQCDSTIQPVPNRFSPKMGGVLCPNCASADTAAPTVSVAALKVMRNLQTNEELMLEVANVGPDVYREVEKHLQDYIAHRLETETRSINVIARLRAESTGS